MPIGFPAYSEKSVRFRGLSRKKLLRVSEEALDELGWRPVEDGKYRLLGFVPFGFYMIFLTWGARLTVEVEEGGLFIRSEGSVPIEWLDVGQHSHNISRFLDRVDDILEDER